MPGIEVFDRPHHETIKQCDVSRRSGAGLNPAARQKLEVLQDAEIPVIPADCIVGLDSRERAGNPTPAIRNRGLVRVPILGLPDVPGNIGHRFVHVGPLTGEGAIEYGSSPIINYHQVDRPSRM